MLHVHFYWQVICLILTKKRNSQKITGIFGFLSIFKFLNDIIIFKTSTVMLFHPPQVKPI